MLVGGGFSLLRMRICEECLGLNMGEGIEYGVWGLELLHFVVGLLVSVYDGGYDILTDCSIYLSTAERIPGYIRIRHARLNKNIEMSACIDPR